MVRMRDVLDGPLTAGLTSLKIERAEVHLG
jgi:hypothetical protein